MGRSVLGASNTVAEVAVLGGLGWRIMGERREEKKVRYGRRLPKLDEGRLVKVVADKL